MSTTTQQRPRTKAAQRPAAAEPVSPHAGLADLLAAAHAAIGGKPAPMPVPAPDSPMGRLVALFDLDPFEMAILAAVAAVELVPGCGTACATASGREGTESLTVGLAIARLPGAHWAALEQGGTPRRWNLVRLGPSPVFTGSTLTLPEPVLSWLMGHRARDTGVAVRVKDLPRGGVQPPSRRAAAARLAAVFAEPDRPHVQLITPSAEHAVALARAIAATLDRALWMLPAWTLPDSREACEPLMRDIARDARLNGALLMLDVAGVADDPAAARLAVEVAERFPDPMLICGPDLLRLSTRPIVSSAVAPLPHAEATDLWRTALHESGLDTGEGAPDPTVLAAQFRLEPAGIAAATASARLDTTEAPPAKRVWQACRLMARARLDDLAQRIDADADWSRLVLPEAELRALEAIAAQVRHRARVLHDWGLAGHGHRAGTSALFHGPSGTGKTMAAEVLAGALDLDLYRIDLSAVVSKYIGETEKNLRRVFDAADESGAILLFDEADALFGKRTEVKDSHDRHANVEVSYLLQRMETYQGLAILTTNLRKNIDDAFLRRIQFVIEFPFPDAALRAAIWRSAFPPAMPLEAIDVGCLSRLAVSGGNIRNIARNAAFLAADEARGVAMEHILEAARREYAKLGQALTAAEMRGWLQ